MRSIIFFLFFFCAGFAQEVWVNGYTRGNGTVVQGHYRSAPDNTINNNWSTIGNVNPHTGKAGTISPAQVSSTSILPIVRQTYSSPQTVDYSYLKPMTYIPNNSDIDEVKPKEKKYFYRGGKYYLNDNGKKNYTRQTIQQ